MMIREHKKYIMHVDMDAFYASIEQMDNPELRGKPIMIGGGDRGVVATCSYEARAFGVRAAMPTYIAKAKCPQGIFIFPRMARYSEISKNIMESLKSISPLIEAASIDEAYIDATGLENIFGSPEDIIIKIKQTIFEASGGLTCSVGVAPIKFLAKIASDENKPNGHFIIDNTEVESFLRKMSIAKIPGVGKKFLEELKKIGIYTCTDVLQLPLEFWERKFGKSGTSLFNRANGVDDREIVPYTIKKSESAESTLSENIREKETLRKILYTHADSVCRNLRKDNIKGRTVTLKVKYADFKQITRQRSFETRTNSTDTIFEHACALLEELKLEKPVRLIGLGVSNFENDLPKQLSLFDSTPPLSSTDIINIATDKKDLSKNNSLEKKRKSLDIAMDNARNKYGKSAVRKGILLK